MERAVVIHSSVCCFLNYQKTRFASGVGGCLRLLSIGEGLVVVSVFKPPSCGGRVGEEEGLYWKEDAFFEKVRCP